MDKQRKKERERDLGRERLGWDKKDRATDGLTQRESEREREIER